MGFTRQTWTLTRKTLIIVVQRHWFATILRAILLPILFTFFITYAKNLFVPPSDFGIGSATRLRSFPDALRAADATRQTVAFVHNGHTGGRIESVINQVSGAARDAGKDIQILQSDTDLLRICRSSLRGTTACYGAVSFNASPDEGTGGRWNYTIRADGYFGTKIYVDETNNDAEIYILPFQNAIDSAIAGLSGASLPSTVEQYPFTSETSKERDDDIRRLYMQALIRFLGVTLYIGIVGIVYHLTGSMASERELALSQLIDAMTPNRKTWHTQAARLLSTHLAFDIIYLPSWLVMGVTLKFQAFESTSYGITIVTNLLAGLSLSSFSVFGGSLFKRAQLSGITVTIVSIVLAIISQVITPRSSGAVAIIGLLFPPMNYTLMIIWMARWERQSLPADLTKGAPDSPWQLPGIALWIFFMVQTLVFPLLGAYMERTLYGTASKERKLNFHPDDPSKAIQLSAFTKEYRPSWWHRVFRSCCGLRRRQASNVLAVNNLSITALQGQIFTLLGANGSGKSTTLDAISGLTEVTGGSIEVDGTGGLGLCPQKNVLWDELTVFEHVEIFNKLKSTGPPSSKAELEALISACDLSLKLNAKAGTLSGGQKRKLQLAMMFVGGSRVCCIDEVSSGLDPLSRRKIWDILLRERGVRTLLFTTHFLDEAQLISDHIAILSKGNLKAEGSAVELCEKLGGGYRVRLPRKLDINHHGLAFIQRTTVGEEVIYQLGDSAHAASFVAALDAQHVYDYQVTGPTIEDVFLKLAEEVQENYALETARVVVKAAENGKLSPTSLTELDKASAEDSEHDTTFQLYTGNGTTMLRQSWILFRKRITILRQNYLPYLFAVIIPVIAAGLVTFFLHNFHGQNCSPESQVSEGSETGLNTGNLIDLLIPFGPPSGQLSQGALAKEFALNISEFHTVDSLDDFNGFIKQRYANVTPGGFFLGNSSDSTPTFAYVGNWQVATALLTQNLLNNILTRVPVVATFRSFALPLASKAGDTLQLILYFGLAMSASPGFFALYPTVERLRNVRALHYSNGIRAGPLFLAYTAFDFLFVLLISALVTIIWVATSDVWYAPGYLFVVFFLYGLTSILLSYCVSLFVSSQLAAFAFAAGGQAVFFLIYFITFMCIVTYVPATQIDHDILIAQYVIGIFFPSGNLLRSLLLTLNEFSTLCRGDQKASYPGAFSVYGSPILYLILQAAVLFTFLVWWDSGYKPAWLIRSKDRAVDEEEKPYPQDADVVAEVARVKDSNDGLRVLHLTKSFGSNTAVNDISFGVQHSETFALLGPNGAGKSTTISLIRGDLRPSRSHGHTGGDVFVEGTSILAHRAAARSHLGVCPQFDAMDTMTCEEHLRFYARARGVPDVEHNVRAIIEAVGLQAFSTRMAAALSGGNKRKLSLAIALMGNPSVLLLDEPSSGMDAASKRIMWRTLEAVSGGRSLVITTHSLEEAEYLADRVGIMAGRMLALGNTEQLRKRYGDAFHVHVVLKGAPHVSDEEAERVKRWIKENIKGALTEDRVFHGQLRFSVPNKGADASFEGGDEEIKSAAPAGISIAGLFSLLEKNKEDLGFEYYSVSQATLDQVFLAVVTQHDVQEEGHAHEQKAKGIGFLQNTRKLWPSR
ncbi:P-loop containing nucleoside triphosphate hydrolase protein [Rhizodiscina lignyota]|uniref:P-loop containing nucleoside triphosphate hydrolase protein n=1 Tax=Rhizodiscina lignyota TaxID=1504668 RepID=A0A9P4IQF9_9PEZI|nr:P-loop containing nucleoside triphosphate hydrolase protein [Rhizodiscina lignyota]